jgi:hypothetical protein
MYTRNPSLGGGTPGGCYTMLYDVYEEPVVGGAEPPADVIRCYTMYTRNPSLGGGTPGIQILKRVGCMLNLSNI